ncbi:MAG: hypothetical protein RL385_2660 [Pseudomonadota bacterium]|jgi:DNA-binding transcriptional LysR family regulator
MELAGIDANLITALHALLTRQWVTRAAADVGLPQSSISRALARLRSRFGDPLLVARGRRLVMTAWAEALVEPTTLAVVQLERVFLSAPEPFRPETSQRRFRLAAPDNVALYLLPTLAHELARRAPRINVCVAPIPPDWRRALLRGDLDLKLGRATALEDGLHEDIFSREPMTCVLRRDHPLGDRPTLAEYAALGHVLVTPDAGPPNPQGMIDELLARRRLTRRIALTVPHFLVAPFVVARTDLALTIDAVDEYTWPRSMGGVGRV